MSVCRKRVAIFPTCYQVLFLSGLGIIIKEVGAQIQNRRPYLKARMANTSTVTVYFLDSTDNQHAEGDHFGFIKVVRELPC